MLKNCKILNKLRRYDNTAIFLIMFIISMGICLNIRISTGDEIWNFQSVYKMYNGLKIYEDINVIITPLFFWCTEIVFHIFAPNLFIFRLCNCFLMATLFLSIYKLLKKLEIPKSISALAVLLMSMINFFAIIRTSFNYNNMALLIFIIGVSCLINPKTRKNVLLQSVIIVLMILTKQNIGIYYGIASVIYYIFSNQKIKEKVQENLKYIFFTFLGICIFIIYLLLNNNLYNFLNYTFGGLLEFAGENGSIELYALIFMSVVILINFIINIFCLKKKIFPEEITEKIKILFIFSTTLLIVCYPIFNWAHILIGTFLAIINIVYIIYLLFKDFKQGLNKIFKIVDTIVIIALLIFSGTYIYSWIKIVTSNKYQYTWEEPFFGGLIKQEEYEQNEKIVNYIKTNKKNVIVFSNKAALYMVPLGRNNGEFDLPFKGNFGFGGENEMMEKIDNMENTQFLISEEKDENTYQESVKLKEYIKNTKKYVGNIEYFGIYE